MSRRQPRASLGIAFKDQSRHYDSIVAYLEALAIRPDFAQAHFHVAAARSGGRPWAIRASEAPAGGEALLRAASLRPPRAPIEGTSSAADSFRSLEEVLTQLGDRPAAERTRRGSACGVPRRACWATARAASGCALPRAGGGGADRRARPLPPRSICTPAARVCRRRGAVARHGYAHTPLLSDDALQYVQAHYAARLARSTAGSTSPGAFYRRRERGRP